MGKRLYVGNLPYDIKNEDLQQLFPGSTEAIVIMDDQGRSKGFGFVELADDADVANVIAEMDGKTVAASGENSREPRPLKVAEAQERPDRSARIQSEQPAQ